MILPTLEITMQRSRKRILSCFLPSRLTWKPVSTAITGRPRYYWPAPVPVQICMVKIKGKRCTKKKPKIHDPAISRRTAQAARFWPAAEAYTAQAKNKPRKSPRNKRFGIRLYKGCKTPGTTASAQRPPQNPGINLMFFNQFILKLLSAASSPAVRRAPLSVYYSPDRAGIQVDSGGSPILFDKPFQIFYDIL